MLKAIKIFLGLTIHADLVGCGTDNGASGHPATVSDLWDCQGVITTIFDRSSVGGSRFAPGLTDTSLLK